MITTTACELLLNIAREFKERNYKEQQELKLGFEQRLGLELKRNSVSANVPCGVWQTHHELQNFTHRLIFYVIRCDNVIESGRTKTLRRPAGLGGGKGRGFG